MKSILVVDDEKELCDLISEQISSIEGVTVKKVYSGIEAFDLLQRESFDTVITDIQMPKMNGIQLMEKIKEEIKPSPVIIAITAYSDYNVESVKAKGASKLYMKPEGLVTLIDDIQKSATS